MPARLKARAPSSLPGYTAHRTISSDGHASTHGGEHMAPDICISNADGIDQTGHGGDVTLVSCLYRVVLAQSTFKGISGIEAVCFNVVAIQIDGIPHDQG